MAHEALRFLENTSRIAGRAARTAGTDPMSAVSSILNAVQAGLDYHAKRARTFAARVEVAELEEKLRLERDALQEAAGLAEREGALRADRLEAARGVIELAASLVQDASAWLALLLDDDIPDRAALERVQEMLEDGWEQLRVALAGWKELGGASHG